MLIFDEDYFMRELLTQRTQSHILQVLYVYLVFIYIIKVSSKNLSLNRKCGLTCS